MRVEYVIFFVALWFVTGPSCSDAQIRYSCSERFSQSHNRTFETIDFPGVSEWCTDRGHKRGLCINFDCCTVKYNCEWFVDPNQAKDGLTNPSPYRRRNCDCEENFYECATNYRHWLDRRMIRLMMQDQMCRRNGEWVSGSTWLEQWVN